MKGRKKETRREREREGGRWISKGRNRSQLVKRIWKSGISEETLSSREIPNTETPRLPDIKCLLELDRKYEPVK